MMSIFHPAITALAFFQATQLNLFERFLTQAISGIDSTSITGGMQDVSYVVLLIGFLWQVYQSAMHGGDVRGLGTNLIKYVVTAVVIMNYHAIFTAINQGFVNAGNWVNSASGATNLLDNWANDLKTQYSQVGFQNLWGLVTGSTAGVLDGILIIVAYILYPVVIAIFGFFYILYGSILYIFGPIVIALMPLGAANRLAKSYAENVFIWNAWPVLYGGFGALLSAVQMGQVGQMLNQNDFLGGLGNLEGSILIGLASIIYSLAIAVIPFIAKKIVSGEVGATAGTLLGAAATALTMGIAATEGVAAGAAAASGQSGTTSASGSTTGAKSGTSAPQGNSPAPTQRESSHVPQSSGIPSKSPNHLTSASRGAIVADGMRGNFEKAVNADSNNAKQSPAEATPATAGEVGETQNQVATTSPSASFGAKSGGFSAQRGPTSALMRPHGLATWGAYHAARVAARGTVSRTSAAANTAKGVVSSLVNPVETGNFGAKAGQVAGTAVNAAEKARVAAGKVANAVTHPRDMAGVAAETVTNSVKTLATGASSAVRGSVTSIKSNFAEAYEKARFRDNGDEKHE